MQHMAAGQCVGYCNDRVCITGCLFNHLFDGYTYIIIRRESLGSWNVDHSCQCIGIFCDFQMLYRKKRYLGVFVSGFLCGTGNWCDWSSRLWFFDHAWWNSSSVQHIYIDHRKCKFLGGIFVYDSSVFYAGNNIYTKQSTQSVHIFLSASGIF